MRRHSRHKRGPLRLVSAVVVFALVVAHVIGGYAHAAGHNHAKGHAACAHRSLSATAAVAGGTSVHDDSEHCDEPADHIDAFDFMCHGGIAILVAPSFAFAAAKSEHASTLVEIAHLTLPTSLERPPKSAVRA